MDHDEPVTLLDWIVPALFVVIWTAAWWLGTGEFRLKFLLIALGACIVLLVLCVIGSLSGGDASCTGSCSGSAVQRWADGADTSTAGFAWLTMSALLGAGTAVMLIIANQVAEGVLLLVRLTRQARESAEADHRP